MLINLCTSGCSGWQMRRQIALYCVESYNCFAAPSQPHVGQGIFALLRKNRSWGLLTVHWTGQRQSCGVLHPSLLPPRPTYPIEHIPVFLF